MQVMTREWLFESVSQLPTREMEQLREYLEFLVWKTKQQPIENSLVHCQGCFDGLCRLCKV